MNGKYPGVSVLKSASLLGVVGLIISSIGCAQVKVTRYSDKSLPVSSSVEVFHKFPDRPYTEFARLSVRNAPEYDPEKELIQQAKKLGADAIVFLPENEGKRHTDQVAVAIQWKESK